MQLSERLSILKPIMLRRDLSAAAKLLAWFLLFERMNHETSLCFSKDTTLAKHLGLTVRTVERAKHDLRQAGFLTWTVNTDKNIGSRASYYRFKKTGSLERRECRATTDENVGLPHTPPDKNVGRRSERESEQLARRRLSRTSLDKHSAIIVDLPLDDAAQFQNWKTAWRQQ